MIIATPNAAPSPAAAPIDTVSLADWQLLAPATAVPVEGQLVYEGVAVTVLVYIIVAVAAGNIAVPAAMRTVLLPDVQHVLAASSWPQQKMV